MHVSGDDVIDEGDEKPGIGALVGRLVEDAKAYARAEIGYAKALAGERLRAARTGIVFLIAGLVLLHGALIALFVGMVLWLSTLIGPLWSMAIVVGVAGAIGAVLAKIGLSHFQRVRSGPDDAGVGVVEP